MSDHEQEREAEPEAAPVAGEQTIAGERTIIGEAQTQAPAQE